MADPDAETLARLHEHAAGALFGAGGAVVPPTREPGAMVHVPFALLPRQVRASGARARLVGLLLPAAAVQELRGRLCGRLCGRRRREWRLNRARERALLRGQPGAGELWGTYHARAGPRVLLCS